MNNPLDAIAAGHQLRRHQFLRSLDWHFDTVGSPPGQTLHLVYENRSDPGHYPTASVDYEYEDPEAINLAIQALTLFSLANALCDNLIKAAIALDQASRIEPDTFLGIRQLDYHIENYYLRVPISLEHLYAIAACLFAIPQWERAPLWKLRKAVGDKCKAIASAVAPLEALIAEVRENRNEVAHTGEFTDNRLSGIRAHLATAEMMFNQEFREQFPQLYRSLIRFQKEFIFEAQSKLVELKSPVEEALDCISLEALPILQEADKLMKAAWQRFRENTAIHIPQVLDSYGCS